MLSQLDALSLKYTAVREPDPADRAPLTLAQKYGERIFRFDDNPYRTMPPASVARTLEYCRIFRRMEEQRDEVACILREGLTLNENFSDLLQTPEVLGGDWDILILGCAGPPPRPLWFRRRPHLYKGFRMARPADFQGAIAGFLIRRQAAQNIRALALPIQKPAEQYLCLAEQYGMRLRFVQPAVVHGTQQEERIAEDAQTIWRDWEAHAHPAEYLRLLDEDALQKPSPAVPNLRTLLQGLYYRFPGSLHLHRSANALLTRSGLSAKLSRRLPLPSPPAEPPAAAADDNDGAGKVAVIIPLFNRERFIIPVIQSLERQTRPPQRLIVVDDGSSDNSAQTVERYFAGAKLPFAAELLRHEQNLGASAARNSGLRQCADCDFVHFLDSDDCPPKDFLQRAATRLAQEPQAVAASADRLFVYGKDEAELSDVSALPDNPWLWFLFEGAALASGTLFRRSVFERTGEFDLSLPTGQDTDMFHRIAHCGKWLRLPGAPVRMLRAPRHNNLFKSYGQSHGRRWMYIWENSLYRQKGVQHVGSETLPRRLHDGWLSAGVALCQAKRFVEANECFRRALAHRFSARALLYLKMPGLPSVLLQKNRLLHLTKRALLRLAPPEILSASDASRGPPPIFVLHPEKPDGDSLSVRAQLDAFSLQYTAIPEPSDQTPQALTRKYGGRIFRLDDNPYRTMPAASVARTPEYCRIFRRMEEREYETVCILKERAVLSEDFPALLQSPETLAGDWDILALGRIGSPPRALRPRLKTRLGAGFDMTRPGNSSGAIAGFLIRRRAAQNIRALALPIQKPVEQHLLDAEQYGMRLRFAQPAALYGQPPEEKPAEDRGRTMWKNWAASMYSAEYLNLLHSETTQTQPETDPPLQVLLQRLYDRLPGGRLLHRGAKGLLIRSGLAPWRVRSPPPPQPAVPEKPPAVADAGKVAVIIPLFNRERLIIPVIQSLERQSRPPQRLIVVDDGSSDNSAQTVERYFAGAKLPFAAELLRHERNRGASAARNSGLQRAADCDFVHFLDSDDCPPQDFLQRAIARLAQEPEAVAATVDRLSAYGGDGMQISSLKELPDNPGLWFLFHGGAIASGTLFRRAVFERAGMFDLSLPTGEDTDIFHRIARCGKWLHLPGAPVIMLQAPEHDALSKNYAGTHWYKWARLNRNTLPGNYTDDSWRRWMYIWENNLYRQAGAQYIEPPALRRRLCDSWLSSGVALCQAKRFAEANECFRRALACHFSVKSLLYLKMPGLPSALLTGNRLLRLTKLVLQRLTASQASSAASDDPGEQVPAPPIFVLHPEKPAAGGPSARFQLRALALEYAAIQEPGPTGQTPQVLAQKYGEHIFRFDCNPYREMSGVSVARTPEYCRIFRRMEEQGHEIACILKEEVILHENFPALLRSPALRGGDWDILVLGCAGAPPRALRFRRRPRLCADFDMARPVDFHDAIAGFLIRRSAAQNIRALALPIEKPVEQCLSEAGRYGMRLRFVQPAALYGSRRKEEWFGKEARSIWRDWLASLYSAEYLALLKSETLQPQPEPDPPLQTMLRRLYHRLPGLRLLYRNARILLLRSDLLPKHFHQPTLPPPQPPLPVAPSAGAEADAGKVAVIIPLFNRERLIIPVIQSLERQARPPQRLIVVDDGSSDNSAQTVERYFADARLPFAAELLRHERNAGAAAARNSGLQRSADCDFVYFLDSDDCPPRDFLQRAVARLAREPEAVAASADRMFLYAEDKMRLNSLGDLPENPMRWLLLKDAAIASGTLFRRSAFERAGMFNPGLPTGEDTDMFHRIARCGKWLHLPGAPTLMLHALEHDNLSKNYTVDDWYNWVRRKDDRRAAGNHAEDGWRRWAYTWENNFYRRAGAQHIPSSSQQSRLYTAWLNSGISLYRSGRFAEANECFRRALIFGFSAEPLQYLKMPGFASMLQLRDRLLHPLRRIAQRLSPAASDAS